MQLEDLQNPEYIKENLADIVAIQKEIDKQLKEIKDEAKKNKETLSFDWIDAKYSSYIKLVPKDITKIIEQYPIQEHESLYNISLSKEALDIITDESLFDEKEIQSVSFK